MFAVETRVLRGNFDGGMMTSRGAIAGQFGISQADVRNALASDQS
jgi:DNA-binding GntR family transcriptional regulator